MAGWSEKASVVLILVVLGICCYRASTQSFTIDEAWVYNLFVSKPLSAMARHYDACNHVLHTLLMKGARATLGGSELALRAPSLLAAVLYCVACFRLTQLVLGGWIGFLCLGLLTLNPMILDFLVAARGYGLGLALFLWALYCAIRYSSTGFGRSWLRWAGVCSGLAIAANLIMLVPAAALGCALLILMARRGFASSWEIVDVYGGPAIAIAFLFVVIPVLPARPEDFYVGAPDLATSVQTLVASFIKGRRHWPGTSPDLFLRVGSQYLAPIVFLALIAGLVATVPRYLRAGVLSSRINAWIVLAGTAVFSVVLVLLLHSTLGVRYPYGRTGIYLLPLFFIAPLYGLKILDFAGAKWVRLTGSVFAAFLLFVCLRQRDNRYFTEWQYDAGTSHLMKVLRNHHKNRIQLQPGEKVRFGTHQFLKQTAIWYKERHRLEWLDDPSSDNLEAGGYRYYLLTPAENQLAKKLGLETIAADPVSGEFLSWLKP
ncbi:MAG: hypothetical protein H7039_08145 [Bryobacteraceae bacterium]|nr:hypothetical protein [Bryobacteraceae bacterium]